MFMSTVSTCALMPAAVTSSLPGLVTAATISTYDCLWVADKPTIKALTGKMGPVIRELGSIKKLFVASLLRYWTAPCGDQLDHQPPYPALLECYERGCAGTAATRPSQSVHQNVPNYFLS
jgi:hypothetical protein